MCKFSRLETETETLEMPETRLRRDSRLVSVREMVETESLADPCLLPSFSVGSEQITILVLTWSALLMVENGYTARLMNSDDAFQLTFDEKTFLILHPYSEILATNYFQTIPCIKRKFPHLYISN